MRRLVRGICTEGTGGKRGFLSVQYIAKAAGLSTKSTGERERGKRFRGRGKREPERGIRPGRFRLPEVTKLTPFCLAKENTGCYTDFTDIFWGCGEMRYNRVWAKLLGLLYVAGLFIFGVSPPVIAEVTTAAESGEPVVVSKPIAVAATERDVTFSAGTFTTGTQDLTLVLQPGETAKLAEFDRLRSLDASGSTCYEELREWGLEHPDVDLRFTVTLPDGQEIPTTADSLDLSGLESEKVAETLEMLAYLPSLKQVDLGSPDAGTHISAEELELIRESLPQAEVLYKVTLLGKELDPEMESLDLSELKSEDAANAAAALAGLPNLKELTLPGGEEGISLDDALLIANAAPNAVIHYPLTLYGKSFDLADEGLDLNHIKVGDGGEEIRRVLPCMRACTWLDMDSCGVGNEQMAQIRDENPNVEVIWRVWFGQNYSVRTNVTKILASMPSKGGMLYNDAAEQLKYCTQVRYLDLGHNENISDFEFIRCMPDLEVVVVSMTGISDLSPFTACPNLLYIEAGNTKIGDLSPLAECTSLKHLNIGTNINVRDITPLYDLDLKRLWIGSYTPVPKDQVAEMQERHPNCVIDTTVPSGLEKKADGGAANSGYTMGWKTFQNRLKADWDFYSARGYFPALRPIGWFKVVYKCFEYDKANAAYSFSWNDPLLKEHDPDVKSVNRLIIDTSLLSEDWTDPSSIIPDKLEDPPGEVLQDLEH